MKQNWNRLAGMSPVASHCQRDKDPSVSQKQMNDYKLLKKKPLTRNYWHYCKQHSPSGNSIQIILIKSRAKKRIRTGPLFPLRSQTTYSSITSTKSPVILHDNFQRDYHKPYGPPTSVIWLHRQSKHTNTGTFTASTIGTQWYTRTLWVLETCDISLRLPTLPPPKAGDFV